MESAFEEIQSGESMLNRSPPSQLVRVIRPKAAAQNAVAILFRYFITYFNFQYSIFNIQFFNVLEFYNGVYRAIQMAFVAGTIVSRVTHEVGVVVECTLIDGEELMALMPFIV